MNRIIHLMMVSTVVASAVALVSCAESAGVALSDPQSGAGVASAVLKTAKVESVKMDLMGLGWERTCPGEVRSALSKVPGVISASTTKTSAKLKVDRNLVTNDQLIAAVRAVGDGYDAHVF